MTWKDPWVVQKHAGDLTGDSRSPSNIPRCLKKLGVGCLGVPGRCLDAVGRCLVVAGRCFGT